MHVKPFLACLNESSGKAVALHMAMVLFVCVEVLRPSKNQWGHVKRGQFT